MKKYFLFISFILLLLFTNASALDFATHCGSGMIIQSGSNPEFGYFAGGNVNVLKNDSINFQQFVEITYLYSDRKYDDNELQVIRTMAITRKGIISSLYADIGVGFWNFVNTKGEDVSPGAFRLNFGYQIYGFDFNIGCDILRLDGPDLYFPNLGVKFLGF